MTIQFSAESGAKPFIKWAGGKGQLVPELLKRIPSKFNAYYEPFLGGGALFFALPLLKCCYLSDINAELISTYEVLRDKPESLIRSLKKHRYEKDYYYQVRAEDRAKKFKRVSALARASRFIFLNKTCFNGLYRVNSQGFYNVPMGAYVNPTICDATNLRACAQKLTNARLSVSTFYDAVKAAKRNDFIYFDPPYVPLSATSNFTGYSKGGFDMQMQIDLRDLCIELDKRGVKFLLSNSSAKAVFKLYEDFSIETIHATRAINSNGMKRGKVLEVLVRNYEL